MCSWKYYSVQIASSDFFTCHPTSCQPAICPPPCQAEPCHQCFEPCGAETLRHGPGCVPGTQPARESLSGVPRPSAFNPMARQLRLRSNRELVACSRAGLEAIIVNHDEGLARRMQALERLKELDAMLQQAYFSTTQHQLHPFAAGRPAVHFELPAAPTAPHWDSETHDSGHEQFQTEADIAAAHYRALATEKLDRPVHFRAKPRGNQHKPPAPRRAFWHN
jgi:hypothetical protein